MPRVLVAAVLAVVFGSVVAVLDGVARPSPAAAASAEWVYLYQADIGDNEAIIVRDNNEVWSLEFGVGCLSIWRYKDDSILVTFNSFFGGIGSRIDLPDGRSDCRIWDSTYLFTL